VALNKHVHSITIEKGSLCAEEGNSPVYGLLVPIDTLPCVIYKSNVIRSLISQENGSITY
jgi:hypothetical protein